MIFLFSSFVSDVKIELRLKGWDFKALTIKWAVYVHLHLLLTKKPYKVAYYFYFTLMEMLRKVRAHT
jgi:hypothetical protein